MASTTSEICTWATRAAHTGTATASIGDASRRGYWAWLHYCVRVHVPVTVLYTLTDCHLLAGFARAIQGVSSDNGWDHLYEMAYLYGFFVSLTVHWALHAIFPAERQRGYSPFVLEEHAEILHGALSEASMPTKTDDEEKGVKVFTSGN